MTVSNQNQSFVCSVLDTIRVWCLRLLLVLIMAPWQLMHWLGFLCDELFFRDYRRVNVRRPVFVLGVPRSGTTSTHRLISQNHHFTTFSTWECLFAPSITERRLLTFIGSCNPFVSSVLDRLESWVDAEILATFGDQHSMSLRSPEEDYLALLPFLMCFILLLPFPGATWLWAVSRLDESESSWMHRRVSGIYHRLIQKHLYFHGEHRRFLSKNAAFAGSAATFLRRYPDARIVICERDSLVAMRSQLSSLDAVQRLFQTRHERAVFRQRLAQNFIFYYRNLDRLKNDWPVEQQYVLPLWKLYRYADEVQRSLVEFLGSEPALSSGALNDRSVNRATKKPLTSVDVAPDIPRDLLEILKAWRQPSTIRL